MHFSIFWKPQNAFFASICQYALSSSNSVLCYIWSFGGGGQLPLSLPQWWAQFCFSKAHIFVSGLGVALILTNSSRDVTWRISSYLFTYWRLTIYSYWTGTSIDITLNLNLSSQNTYSTRTAYCGTRYTDVLIFARPIMNTFIRHKAVKTDNMYKTDRHTETDRR